MKLQSIQNFKSVLQRGLQFSRPAKGNGTQNENILSHTQGFVNLIFRFTMLIQINNCQIGLLPFPKSLHKILNIDRRSTCAQEDLFINNDQL